MPKYKVMESGKLRAVIRAESPDNAAEIYADSHPICDWIIKPCMIEQHTIAVWQMGEPQSDDSDGYYVIFPMALYD